MGGLSVDDRTEADTITAGEPSFDTSEEFPIDVTGLARPRPAITVTVGLRHNAPVQQRCAVTEFTQALGNLNESQTLPPFQYPWRLSDCDQPRIFTREEACDILASFRGVYLAGDSLVRHLWDVLLLLLTNDIGSASFTDEAEVKEQCREEPLFPDRRPNWHQTKYRAAYYRNIDVMQVCAGRKASAKFDYNRWSGNLAAPTVSIVFLSGAGIYQNYDFDRVRKSPDPSLEGNYFPGANIAQKCWASQAPEVVKEYNAKFKAVSLNSGRSISMKGSTLFPAQSYEGQHYSYQVDMDQAQTFLNILNLIHWRDAARRGGLATEEWSAP
ncbi:BQ2448_5488 [Microbotryum intermedium]|uniref:BQ2448_5488 protein n=1 Tax=Microbotryum intermedium TaxID=269621 RepID=A0A238F4A0_9BASI|nr:BQ2448_5488 [Microbotryum intermedium]